MYTHTRYIWHTRACQFHRSLQALVVWGLVYWINIFSIILWCRGFQTRHHKRQNVPSVHASARRNRGLILLSIPSCVAHLCSTECAYWHADHSSRLHYRTTSGVCWGVACATDVVHSLSFPALPTVISHLAVVNVIAKRWVWKARCVSHKGKTFAVYYKDTDALVCGIFCHKHFLQFQGLLWYFVIWVSYNAGSRTDLETKFERYFLESFFRERNYSFLGQ